MKRKKYLFFTAALCSILIFRAVPAFGAHPLFTDDTFTQGKGKTQIETSFLYDRDNDDGIKTEIGRPKVQLTYGLLDPLDVILEIPYLFLQQTRGGVTTSNDGISDITLSLKWRFYGEKEKGLQFAIKPSVTFPTGDEAKGLGFGREAYGITFISTFEREEWCVSANLGYLYNDYGLQSNRDAYRKDIWSASLSGQYEFVEKLWLVGEVGVLSNPKVSSDTPPAYILGGFIYEITKSIEIDIGYRYGLNKPMVDNSILAGITIRF
jgi:hypothetical protein